MREDVKVQHRLRGLNPTLVMKIYPFLGPNSDTRELLRQIKIQSEASQLTDRHVAIPPANQLQPSTFNHSLPPHHLPLPPPNPVFATMLPQQNSSTSSDGAKLEQVESRLMEEIKDMRKDFKSEMAAEREFLLSVMKQLVPSASTRPTTQSLQAKNKRTHDGRPICNHCNKPNHIERFCFEKKKLTGANATPLAANVTPGSSKPLNEEPR